MPTKWTIILRDDLMVVETDPEMSDMVNPRGEIIKLVNFLMAESKDGRRYTGPCLGYTDPREVVESKVKEFAATLPDNWTPIGNNDWNATYPAYGSKAYMATEGEQAYYDNADENGCAAFVGYEELAE